MVNDNELKEWINAPRIHLMIMRRKERRQFQHAQPLHRIRLALKVRVDENSRRASQTIIGTVKQSSLKAVMP